VAGRAVDEPRRTPASMTLIVDLESVQQRPPVHRRLVDQHGQLCASQEAGLSHLPPSNGLVESSPSATAASNERRNGLTALAIDPQRSATGRNPSTTGNPTARPRGFEPLTFGSVDRRGTAKCGSTKPNSGCGGARKAPENRNRGRIRRAPPTRLGARDARSARRAGAGPAPSATTACRRGCRGNPPASAGRGQRVDFR